MKHRRSAYRPHMKCSLPAEWVQHVPPNKVLPARHGLADALLWLMLLTTTVLGVSRLLRDEQRIGSNLDDALLAFRLAESACVPERQPANHPFSAWAGNHDRCCAKPR
jgi:hypothetical protein